MEVFRELAREVLLDLGPFADLGGKRVMSRIITEEGVLETIFALAGVTPSEESEGMFAGHPLVSRPTGAAFAFYGIWPVLVAGAFWLISRRQV